MTTGAAVLHFGIVRTAGQDIAIASSDLVEAVDMPPRLLAMPEPSTLMAGMFLLRGQLVPVLDLQRLMAPAAASLPAPAPPHRFAGNDTGWPWRQAGRSPMQGPTSGCRRVADPPAATGPTPAWSASAAHKAPGLQR